MRNIKHFQAVLLPMFLTAVWSFSAFADNELTRRWEETMKAAGTFANCYNNASKVEKDDLFELSTYVGNLQDSLIADLEKAGRLKVAFTIKTNVSGLNVGALAGEQTFYFALNEKQELKGIAYSSTKYPLDHSRSFRRIFNLYDFNDNGVRLAEWKGRDTARIRGNLNDQGGKFLIEHVQDFDKKQISKEELIVAKNPQGEWEVINPRTGRAGKTVQLNGWANIFMNFGIEKIELQ